MGTTRGDALVWANGVLLDATAPAALRAALTLEPFCGTQRSQRCLDWEAQGAMVDLIFFFRACWSDIVLHFCGSGVEIKQAASSVSVPVFSTDSKKKGASKEIGPFFGMPCAGVQREAENLKAGGRGRLAGGLNPPLLLKRPSVWVGSFC